jgi:hypothetical protein
MAMTGRIGRRQTGEVTLDAVLDPALDGQQSAVYGADQCGVVGLGLIGVTPCELAQCLVNPL